MRLWAMLFITAYLVSGNAAYAETNYRCLKVCLAKGNTYYKCKPSCTLGGDGDEAKYGNDKNVLVKTPLPWQGHDLIKKKTSVKQALEQDYSCLKNCLSKKIQYNFCSQRCKKHKEMIKK